MPLRPLLVTLVTVALALIAVALWLGAVAPLIAQVPAATRPAPGIVSHEYSLHVLFHSTLLFSFILICLLLVIGLFATAREWIRRPEPTRPRYRTNYLDIWKLSGERLSRSGPPDSSGSAKPPPFQ